MTIETKYNIDNVPSKYKRLNSMKRCLFNILVFILMLPSYVLLLVSYVYKKSTLPIIMLIGRLKIMPYRWFEIIDRQMYKIYENL
jgi:hypothetical protein